MRTVTSTLSLIAGLSLWIASTGLTLADDRNPMHDRAVELARSGQYAPALELLAELRRASPEDLSLIFDETVILIWAGDDLKALENADLIDSESAPEYVVDALAKANRNTGRFEQALHLYELLLLRDPANLEARLGMAMTYADLEDLESAHDVLESAPEEHRNEGRLLALQASLYEQDEKYIDALASYQRTLEAIPGNSDALRGQALLLRKLLLPREALAVARANPGVLSDTEVAQLEVDIAAMELRHGEDAVSPPDSRYEKIDDGLARIEKLLTRHDIADDVRIRLEYDRVIALTARRRPTEAIVAFEALNQPLSQIPVYVLQSAGTAYLEVHRPDRAREILEHAVERQPGNPDLKFRLFFAYTDLQQFDKARTLTTHLLETLERTYQAPDSSVVKGSPDYLRASILAGLVRAYADQLAESQEYFEALLSELPHNTDIRHELANVYRWRGWTDRALEQYAQVLAVEPGFVAAQVGYAHTRLDARNYDQVDERVEDLQSNHGDQPPVMNLARRWQIHNQHEVRVDARSGKSSGATFGDREYQVDSTWYSRPFVNRYRILLRTHDSYARFPEGEARRRRAGLGIEYRYGRLRTDAAVSASRDGGDAGLSLSVDYRASDVLNVGGRVDIKSNDVPLRGYRVNVSGNLINVFGRYNLHESTGIGVSLTTLDLSDGNTINSMLLSGEHRLFNWPRAKIIWIADAYAANRELNDVAYYSPANDISLTTGLRADWSIIRRHHLSLSQSITALAGKYDQSGFGSGTLWAADYRISLAVAEKWYLDLGARRQRSFYDGAPEYGNFVSVGLSGRF